MSNTTKNKSRSNQISNNSKSNSMSYLIQKDHEMRIARMAKEFEIGQSNNHKKRLFYEDKIKRFNHFKKFQFDTEYEQQIKSLKNFIRSKLEKEKMDELEKLFNQEQKNKKYNQKSKDKVQFNPVKIEVKDEEVENTELYHNLAIQIRNDLMKKLNFCHTPTEEHLSAPLLESTRNDFNYLNEEDEEEDEDYEDSTRDSTVSSPQLEKNDQAGEYTQNKRLSVVLTGKLLDHYRIFKFQENGRFLNNTKQPHIHKIASLDDQEDFYKIQFEENRAREKLTYKQSQDKLRSFLAKHNDLFS